MTMGEFVCRNCGMVRDAGRSAAHITSFGVHEGDDPAGDSDDLVRMRPSCACGSDVFIRLANDEDEPPSDEEDEILVLDESDQRKILAGLSRGAFIAEERHDEDRAEDFWDVRNRLIEVMSPKNKPLDDLVVTQGDDGT